MLIAEPINISGLTLKNRIVRAAMYEKLADEDGFVTNGLIELYINLANGGAGLIITGAALVHPSGRYLTRMLSIHSNRYINGLKKLTDEVHGNGGIIALQISHGGPQSPAILLGGASPLSPSSYINPFTRSESRAMTDSEIWEAVDAFAEAAWRARSAGFDAVELHAAHGLLISGFLSPYINKRDDYWGGDEERRVHFLEEVCKAVREATGADFPVIVKINADDLVDGGLAPDESARIAGRLEETGVDAIEISGGLKEPPGRSLEKIGEGAGKAYFEAAGMLIKGRVSIPVILTGGIRTLNEMEGILSGKAADLIGLARPLLREPDLPLKLMSGKDGADCISCGRCSKHHRHPDIRCRQIPAQS